MRYGKFKIRPYIVANGDGGGGGGGGGDTSSDADFAGISAEAGAYGGAGSNYGGGYDSWGGGGYGFGSGGSVAGNFGAPGTGTGGDFGGVSGNPSGSVSDDLAQLHAEVVAGYEKEKGEVASKAEKSFLAKAIDTVSFLAPGGTIASLASKAATGYSIGQNIAMGIAASGVPDPFGAAAKGSSFYGGGGTSAGSPGSGDGNVFFPTAVNSILAGAGLQSVSSSQIAQAAGSAAGSPTFDSMLKMYDLTSIKSAIKSIQDVNTNVQYAHTLSDLSGIGLSDSEKQYFTAQKQIAIDRAIGEIENTFKPEGDAIIAQQVYNLGTNALGGTIGREFYNRWQERKARAETSALQDITSTFLTAEQAAIDKNKAYQLDMWNKKYDAESESAKLALDKAKASAAAQYTWDQSYLDRLANLRGQDISAEQQNLDRLLKERLGETEYSAWKDTQKSANLWGAIGGIGSGVVKSDWFGDIISSWF